MKPRHKRSRRIGGILQPPPDPPPPVYKPPPTARRVIIGGVEFAAWNGDEVLDWLGDQGPRV